jgi:hypothetical protein
MRTFGCACWSHLRPYNSHKLQFRSKQCVFLGYSVLHKGFKCLDVASGCIYVSRDVIFDETIYPFSHLNPNAGAKLRAEVIQLPPQVWVPSSFFRGESVTNPYANVSSNRITELSDEQEENLEQNPEENNSEEPASAANIRLSPVTEHEVDLPPTAATPTAGSFLGIETVPAPAHATEGGQRQPEFESSAPLNTAHGDLLGSSVPSPAVGPSSPRTRLQHGIRRSKVYTDGTIRYGLVASTGEPNSLDEALANDDWKQAMQLEHDALMKNKTWHLVPPQKGMNIIGCKWVYKD